MKKVLILGCTGSIGKSTLAVLHSHPEKFTLCGLQAHKNEEALLKAGNSFPDASLCLSGARAESGRIHYHGEDGILRLIEESDADIVVNGIVGAAGLPPSVKVLEKGMDLALANKESMVLGGALLKGLAHKSKSRLLPVDSEHSAVFQLLEHRPPSHVREIILTASGGPFRERPLSDFSRIRPKDALKHPTWNMGAKITIDSATMANKGLEVIEALQLFDFPIEKIKVLIHPQSCVHSLIRTTDGALYAQISAPDMRLPIQDALFYPEVTSPVPSAFLNLEGKSLDFYKADFEKFPMLALAFDCARSKGGAPIIYNGVNEVAVETFLAGNLSFPGIAALCRQVLEEERALKSAPQPDLTDLDAILNLDRRARLRAREIIQEGRL